jgi:hypothetical protein
MNTEGQPATPEAQGGGSVAPPHSPTAPPLPSVEPWYRDRTGWVLVAGGVVAMGVGGALFFEGASIYDDAFAERDESDLQSLVDSANTYRIVGSALFWAGAATAVVGAVKLAITDSPPSRGTAVTLGPGWVTVKGSF